MYFGTAATKCRKVCKSDRIEVINIIGKHRRRELNFNFGGAVGNIV